MTVRAGAGGIMADDGEKRSVTAAPEAELPSPPAAATAEPPPPPPSPLKEWAPLPHLMLQVPAKYQNLLVTGELQLTCVSAVEDHILLGTNTGSVYWYDTVSCTMQRYRAEGPMSPVCRVSAVTSVDHLLAVGHRSGGLSVFLVPRLARGDVPEYVRITERNIKKSLQFQADAGHRSPVTALAWSRNAVRLFSGDEAGVVAVTEIDYVTETVACQVVLREPSPVVQLQYNRQTLLVATRARSCLLTWPDTTGAAEPRQVGTKPRKSPADLGACFVETEAGLAVLAARPSLKVVTADLQGQVSATISLKPTLGTAGCVPLLFPVSGPGPGSGPDPGRLLPLWPGAVALYDSRILLVVDVTRWEILWRCDQLPAVLDVAAADGAIFVLCSARRLIRLSQAADNHPAVCENLRPANGDTSFDEVMQELRSAVPVNQMKTLLTSVSGQLGRSGLLDALSSQKEAVSSLTSRVGSLVISRLSRPGDRERPGDGPPAGPPAGRGPLRTTISSPDVRGTEEPVETAATTATTASVAAVSTTSTGTVADTADAAPAAPAAAPADAAPAAPVATPGDAAPVGTSAAASPGAGEPIARQLRTRRGPGRRRAAPPGTGGVQSLETVSLGGETAATTETAVSGEGTRRRSSAERVTSQRASDPMTGSVRSVAGARPNQPPVGTEERTEERLGTEGRTENQAEERAEERTEDRRTVQRRRDVSSLGVGGAGEEVGGHSQSVNPAAAAPQRPLDFTQFYPREVRTCLQRSDSQLEEEQRDKERRLAAMLGLEELLVPPPPPPPPPPMVAASSGSSASPSPPASGVDAHRGLFTSVDGASTTTTPDPEPEPEPEPEPSYHTLFPFNTKRTSAARRPPQPAGVDGETGEPSRPVIEVQYPATAAASAAAELEVGTELTEGSDPASAAADWRPWQRHAAPSYVMTLSACARYAVMTDADNRVLWTPSAASARPAWERLDYSACQVAVSWDGQRVWRLDQGGAVYSLADPGTDRPCGTHWVLAARDVLQLAADTAAVWYIKRGGKLFVQRDLSAHRCASSALPVTAPGPVIHVTAREGVVWIVTDTGEVWWRVGVSRAQLAGYSWEPLALGSLHACAVFLTAGELGWLVDDRRRLHVTSGVSASLPRGMDGVWRRVLAERSSGLSSGQQVAVMAPGAALRPALAVEGDVAWLTEPGVMNVMVCRHHITAVHWEQFVTRGRRLDWAEVHADSLYRRRGQLWTVSEKGQLYGGHGHDGDLQLVPLPSRTCQVACISAAPGVLWLLTASGAVFVREGVEQTAVGTDWVPLDLLQIDECRLVHLSVGAQSVWACDASGRILVRLGPTVARRSAAALQPAWVPIDQPPGVRFTRVSVGPADQPVWALDSAGVPWRRCGLQDQPVVGTHWQPAGGVTALALAISPAGVWARSRGSGLVHRWMEAAGRWCRVPGTTQHVSVSVSGELWVVHRGALYTLHELALWPGRCVVPRVSDQPPTSPTSADNQDWALVTF